MQGDCRATLRTLPAESVHCCITSPPYWGLRAYGTEPQVWGGLPTCTCDTINQEVSHGSRRRLPDLREDDPGLQEPSPQRADSAGTPDLFQKLRLQVGAPGGETTLTEPCEQLGIDEHELE